MYCIQSNNNQWNDKVKLCESIKLQMQPNLKLMKSDQFPLILKTLLKKQKNQKRKRKSAKKRWANHKLLPI